MKYTEAQIKNAVKTNGIVKFKFSILYGKEVFLVKFYTDKIIEACVAYEDRAFNFTKFEGNPALRELSDAVFAVPVFAGKRAVLINDFNPETADADYMKGFTEIIKAIPDENAVVISETGVELDVKKAKTKKFVAETESFACACEFAKPTPPQAAKFAARTAERQGVILGGNVAMYLAERTLSDLTQIENELGKLCAFAKSGGTEKPEITKETVDMLVPEKLDVKIYSLTDAVTARDFARSYKLFNGLAEEGYEPVVILSALSGTFTDYYRAKLALNYGKTSSDAANDFSCSNRAWALGKAFSAVRKIDMKYIKHCVKVLFDADYKLKSSSVGKNIIIEKAITEIIRG